ncbi:hypothetical protein A2348_04750 [Candidatus Uhrbacteria bacterium RIFOXYB12_FULL_58_10]|uniref:Uncharacterized protein n=1 Tax=Candidatus Uhrbacteria bacterium RIFOXYB2_FULL_57_15 TaxID=1802422 RepID=A0A1F7W8M0_9BACT|nr:MAG: hypothetical protein A2348_04750 [Candidatus Uhrbacteria bacterium RIFOXYB12_FULL_58_10]OGL99142.1 MAG: hypothetical protein A2304_03240 [Candidatus Uhrbacteria bacterium RIFOXYB2_FULL_57_15]
MPERRTPLAFTIVITPNSRGGYEVETSPRHPLIAEVVETTLRGRVTLRRDQPTVITAPTNRSMPPMVNGFIAPRIILRGLLQLAEVGAEDLRQVELIVIGYLYDAVVAAVLGSLESRGFPTNGPPTIAIDDGPIPQIRTVTRSWWRDVRHVVMARDEGTVIRLRGIPRGEPFAKCGNDRILARFATRLAHELRVPVERIVIQDYLQVA